MHAVFFSEIYDASGGAADYFGQVESVDQQHMLAIVMEFIIDRMMGSHAHYPHNDSSTTRFSGRYRITTLNMETHERSFGFVTIEKSGRLIEMFDETDEGPAWIGGPTITFPRFTYDVQLVKYLPLTL